MYKLFKVNMNLMLKRETILIIKCNPNPFVSMIVLQVCAHERGIGGAKDVHARANSQEPQIVVCCPLRMDGKFH